MSDDALWDKLQGFVGLPVSPPVVARDPVNLPMIRHWCDAMGDNNPIYTDPEAAAASVHGEIVAPPAMLQVWTMQGLRRPLPSDDNNQAKILAMVEEAGYAGVVATNSNVTYHRYLRLGDVLTLTAVFEDISPLKRTALGEGYFITSRQEWHDQHGELVGSMNWRILKFKPGAKAEAPAPWPHPAVNRDSEFFWEGTAANELRIQRCVACGVLRHPPGPACARCGSYDWDYQVAAGTGSIYSFVIHHHPPLPPHQAPFVVALVQLDEGTRVVGNLLGADPDTVAVGQRVRVSFERVDTDLVLPQWRREEDQ